MLRDDIIGGLVFLTFVAVAVVSGIMAVTQPASAGQSVGRISVPVPDCGEALCVMPKDFVNEWVDTTRSLQAENKRLRDELKAKPAVKCEGNT